MSFPGMEIYSTLVSEILKYYYDVEDINGNDYDEFEYAQNIFSFFSCCKISLRVLSRFSDFSNANELL